MCKVCKNDFKTSHSDRKHCSRACSTVSKKGIRPSKCFTSETAKIYGFQKDNELGFIKGYNPWNKGLNVGFSGMTGKKHKQESKDKISGEKNFNWKGDKAGHHSFHTWVRTRLGTPKKCEHCGTTDAKFFDWANKSGEYKRDLNDWIRLCRKCHRQYDEQLGRGSMLSDRFGDKTGRYSLV